MGILILNYETCIGYCEEHERYNAKVYLAFIKGTLKQYTDGKIVMILDNTRIQHFRLVQPFLLEIKDRIELMYYNHIVLN